MNRTKNSIFCGPSYGSNQSRRGSSNDAPFVSFSLFCLSKCECMMIGKRKHGLLFFSFSPNNLGGECVNKPTTLSYQPTPPGGLHRYANRLSPTHSMEMFGNFPPHPFQSISTENVVIVPRTARDTTRSNFSSTRLLRPPYR